MGIHICILYLQVDHCYAFTVLGEEGESMCEDIHENKISRTKQEIEFTVHVRGNVIQKIYNTCIYHPTLNFKGGSVKWHEDVVRK